MCIALYILSAFRVSVEKTSQATRPGFKPTTSGLLVQTSINSMLEKDVGLGEKTTTLFGEQGRNDIQYGSGD